ncbi:DUF4070 domain-containing protein [bacterium]|nr:DUF4070 domain-containing protein [bacterium]
MKKTILMIYPKIPITFWSNDYALEFTNKKSGMPPLGLLTVAAMIPDNYELKLVDMNTTELDIKALKEADMVFISAMLIQIDSFEEIVKLCNQLNKLVVAGGPYPMGCYEDIKGVDCFVLNEAEITLPLFFRDYENGNLKKIYMSHEKADITKTPPPRWDLIDINLYATMALQYSRGCPFNCEFCDIIEMYGRRVRTKTPGQFLGELDGLYETGFKGFLFIVDDNFAGNMKKTKAVLEALVQWQIRHNYPFHFLTEASIDLARRDDILDLLVQASFIHVFIGIESPDVNTLKKAQKKQNIRDDMLESVKKIQRRGINVMAGFILGFDTDPEDIFDMQLDFIQKAAIPVAMVGLLGALPNTQLYRRLEKENRLIHDTILTGNNVDPTLNFIPIMPKEKLLEGFKRVVTEIYKPENYFQRCTDLIRRIPDKHKIKMHRNKSNISAFFISLWRQSTSGYGRHYLRFLYKTLCHNWRIFPLAVLLAIQGHHYITVAKEIFKGDYLKDKKQRTIGKTRGPC